MRFSTLVVRGTVDELMPGVMIGCCMTEWVGTPTRLHVTEVIYASDSGAVIDDPIILQAGGTAGSLTIEFENEPVLDVGTDVLMFAAPAPGQPGDPSQYWTVLAAEIDAGGRLIDGGNVWWTGAAPFLADATFSDISSAIRALKPSSEQMPTGGS